MPIDLRERHSGGPFGERYIGRDTSSGRDLLVTVPRLRGRDLDDETKTRILAAVQRRQALIHPHVCALVNAGFTESGQLAIAQELPPGALTDAGPDAKGADTLIHLCEALAYAHARGVVHGALTPDCVILDGTQSARIADFGVGAALYEAGVLGDRADAAVSASPEVKAGGEPTPAGDVYALGAVGVGLCSAGGAPPDSTEALIDRAHRVAGAGLAAVLGRAIEGDPKARFASAEEMLKQLRTVVAPRTAPRPAASSRKRRTREKRKPEPPPEPEMGYAKAFGLLLWTGLRSGLALLLGIGLIAACVAGGLALALRNTPALTTVPNLESRPVSQAVAVAESRGLEVTVGRERHHTDVPAGHVVEHSPYPGKRVREGRVIELVVSAGPPRSKVPKLIGKSRAQAKDLLAAANLRLGTVSRDGQSSKPADEVLAQNPSADKEVPVGTEVNITISAKKRSSGAPRRGGPRAADVTVIVPEGPVVQRVRVEVHYPSGRYTLAYERVHRPGDEVKVHVAASGEASVHTLIDGKLVAEYDLEPSP